jgi:hypothetical protein
LRSVAGEAAGWEAERAAALAVLEEDALERGGRYGGPVLIDALLDDGDLDAAWREAAGRADDRQWARLADRSRETRPAEALGVYLRRIERLKEPTGERAYEHLARLLRAVRDCSSRAGDRGRVHPPSHRPADGTETQAEADGHP